MDKRLKGMCVYCGAMPDTRDHVPSKVLLDEQFPQQLPVVDACARCNEGFSLDEQYLACFIECVICGTTEPLELQRPNIKRILVENTILKERIAKSQALINVDSLTWQPEVERVRNVVTKLAQGHIAYELFPILEEPTCVSFAPLSLLSDHDREVFEDVTSNALIRWPEIGSRAFHRAIGKNPDHFEIARGWIVVQPGRYRYSVVETDGVIAKMVLSEYLACFVSWNYL